MKIGAIILAGGKSSRMGQDKGLLLLHNKPMIVHLLDTVRKLTDDVIIISNNSDYLKFELPVYEDLIKDAGPLAGIYTGLTHSKHNKNIVLSCDVPFVSIELLNHLIESSKNYDVVIPTNNNKTHQVIGIYDKTCIPLFKEELEINQRKIKEALKKVRLNVVDANQFSPKDFVNINTPEDLRRNVMEFKVIYFGMIAEAIGKTTEDIQFSQEKITVKEITELLLDKYPKLQNLSFKIAINHTIANENEEFKINDEIALLPPFAGG